MFKSKLRVMLCNSTADCGVCCFLTVCSLIALACQCASAALAHIKKNPSQHKSQCARYSNEMRVSGF